MQHVPWNEQSIKGFTIKKLDDDDDGSTSYKEFYHGRFYYERRNGLGTHRYQFIYENGEAKSKMGFSGHQNQKEKGKSMLSLWYCWPQGK